MMSTFEAITVPLELSEHGVIRIRNSRISLDSVLHAYNEGATPEEIVYRFPVLQLEAVYAVISYALQHPEFVNDYLQERQLQQADLQKEIRRLFPRDGLRARLLSRHQKSGSA
ncbi:MAG: DUF433 domain-containing protein [Chloroflexi bacterium]|nr:DUF433 domain-containing protein [Chloroflexota bacterium]